MTFLEKVLDRAGLPAMTEEAAKALVSALCDQAMEDIAADDNDLNDLALPVIQVAKARFLKQLDSVDGQ